jgi:glycosyltransferase involved in cell wall biosynthesis
VQGSPLVSVVTPFYNTAEYLEECIRSVLAQDCADFEYLLCDNASDDGSSEIARRYAAQDSRIRYLRFEEHLPQEDNYNRALARICGGSRFCKVVQADDWLVPGGLERLVAAAEEFPDAAVVCGDYVTSTGVASDDLRLLSRGRYDGRELGRRVVANGEHFSGTPTTVLYRSEHVRRRSPRFFPAAGDCGDTNVFLELAAEHPVAIVKERVAVLRTRGDSITADLEPKGAHYLWRFWLTHRYASLFLSEDERRAVTGATRDTYFWWLGSNALRLRRTGFWSPHLRVLRDLGWRRPWPAIIAAAACCAGRRVLRAVGRPVTRTEDSPRPARHS